MLSRKKLMVLFSLLIITLFLISCAPKQQVSEEEALAQLEGLSDEERDAVLAKSGALTGQAYNLPAQSVPKVKQVKQVAKSFKWLECTDDDGGINNEVVGKVTVKYTYGGGPVKEISYTDICQQGTNLLVEYYCKDNNYATATANCQYGCELVTPTSGKCKEASFVVAPPGPSELPCGNGVVDPEEQCDDPQGDSSGEFSKNCINLGFNGGLIKCTKECKFDTSSCNEPLCGDGLVVGNEQCDDGNKNNGDGCSSLCAKEVQPQQVCGNNKKETGESCDGSDLTGLKSCEEQGVPAGYKLKCSPDCKGYGCYLPFCGDGKLDQGEQCDDSNVKDGDGCSSQCTKEVQQVCTPGMRKCDDLSPLYYQKCKSDGSGWESQSLYCGEQKMCKKDPAAVGAVCVDAPDLTVSNVVAKFGKNVTDNDIVDVTATITNKGKVSAGHLIIRANFSSWDENWSASNFYYGYNSPLGAGESKTVNLKIPIYNDCPNKGNVTFEVDFNNQVVEYNEWNNKAGSPPIQC